jgi:GNAT superfamily N-acetyltransferase
MHFVVEEARGSLDLTAIQNLENQVFRTEKQIDLPRLRVPANAEVFRLVARATPNGTPVGTLTVVDSNTHCPIFRRYGNLISSGGGRAARFTRLAVLPDYRGHSLSMRLILEAERRFIAPQNIQHTWLLFDASRASTSLLANLLGFHCGHDLIRSEYGPCRLLFRDELSIKARNGNRRGWAFLTALAASNSVPEVESLFSRPFGATVHAGAIPLPPAA